MYKRQVEALHEDTGGVDVEFSTGPSQRFDLVIGADGLRSGVRESAFGPARPFEHYLGYCAASFVTTGYPHRDDGVYLSFAQPGRQVSRYAMRGDRSAFLFVFAADEPPAGPHDRAAHEATLRRVFGGDGWETPEMLARLGDADDLYFDAVSQIRMPQWHRGRVALVGDAAYCPSLLAGAGAAFAMLGAYVLAGELARAGGDHVVAFAAYERRLRPFIEAQQRDAERFAGSFAPKTAFGLFVRNAVLGLMRFEPLARWYSRRMFEHAFDLPDYRG